MTVPDSRYVLLHGTAEPTAPGQVLQAGPVTALLDGVDLRYIRIGRVELVRRVYAAVRDVDWNTLSGEILDLEVDAAADSFEVSFRSRHRGGDIDFTWAGRISGAPSGRIAYSFEGQADTEVQYNRIGLCVHHPWRELAGATFRAGTPAGEIEGVFPDLIAPQGFENGVYQALFPAFDRLEVALAGGSLLFEFEGDLWETEDHRNWTDANFKTYSTPIALGFPHRLEAGATLAQQVAIVPSGVSGPADDGGPVRLTIGVPTGTTVPAIGLGDASHTGTLDDGEAERLAALGPAHLRAEARLDRGDWRETLARGQAAAGRIGCALEVALHVRAEHEALIGELASALSEGPDVARVLVILAGGRTATPEETTPAGLVDSVRAALARALPGAAFVGGTEMYFTEINRTRPQAATWDGVCFSIAPQIHAFTDLDVMENLDAQGENVRSALAFDPGKPIVVSPVTLRRRENFHAAVRNPPAAPGELPDAVDVRQPSLFGAAWTAGSLKYLSEAGASSVTYFETTGWRGVIEREAGSPLPELFPSRPGQTFPLYHPLADVAGWRGAAVLSCVSADPLSATALAVRTEDGAWHLLVANLTPRALGVTVGPLDGAFRLRRLDEASAATASSKPAAFRAQSTPAEAGGDLVLALEPYEVVRIDPA
jgi:D-apionolactonase